MTWSPEGNLLFGVFRKKGHQLKYVKKASTHTPGTRSMIPSGVLDRIEKLTSQIPSLHSEGVEKVYPDHVNALRKSGLAPPKLPKMGDLWKMQDEKLDMKNEKEPDINRRKNRNFYFCVAYSRYLSLSIHRVINRLKNITIYPG